MVAKIAVWKMHVLNGSMARYFSVTAPEGASWADELQTEAAAIAIIDMARAMLGDKAADVLQIEVIDKGITLTFKDFAASIISEWRLFQGAVCTLLVHPSDYIP